MWFGLTWNRPPPAGCLVGLEGALCCLFSCEGKAWDVPFTEATVLGPLLRTPRNTRPGAAGATLEATTPGDDVLAINPNGSLSFARGFCSKAAIPPLSAS